MLTVSSAISSDGNVKPIIEQGDTESELGIFGVIEGVEIYVLDR